MNTLENLTPQEQECIEAVKKAPEEKKQSVFERACEIIKNKTTIATLALTLWLSQPALANNSPESHPKYDEAYTMMVERAPTLDSAQHEFFATLYVNWLDAVLPWQQRGYDMSIRWLIWAVERKNIAMYIVDRMIDRWVISADHPYTKTLIEVTKEIDAIWQENIARIERETKQADEKIQQADEKIQQADEKIQQAEQWSDFRNNLWDRVKNLQ